MQAHTNVEGVGNLFWRPNTRPTSLLYILNKSNIHWIHSFLFQASP